MARHRSVPKAEQRKLQQQQQITDSLTKMIGDCKPLRYKGYDQLLKEAQRDMGLRSRLSQTAADGGEAGIVARRRLAQLRDVKYYVDKPVTAGDLYHSQVKGKSKPNRKVKS